MQEPRNEAPASGRASQTCQAQHCQWPATHVWRIHYLDVVDAKVRRESMNVWLCSEHYGGLHTYMADGLRSPDEYFFSTGREAS